MKKMKWCTVVLAVMVLLAGCIYTESTAPRGRDDYYESSKSLPTPASSSRLIIVTGLVKITDDEPWPWDDEHAQLNINGRCTLSRNNPTCTFSPFVKCAGGEVRVEINLSLSLRSDDSVDVSGTAELFEGTSCNTMDREDDQSFARNVAKGYRAPWQSTLLSRGMGGGDKAEIDITIENTQ
jgi:hypothetical protein